MTLKVRACKGWSRPQGWGYFPLLKTCQLSFSITEYHVTNIKATWQWECLFSYWSRLEHEQSFHLLLAIVKRRLYWPILTLSQGGDYISQKLMIFVSKLTHQNFNTNLCLNWKAVISVCLLAIDFSVMYFICYLGDILLAIIIILYILYNYHVCEPEENFWWIFMLHSGTEGYFVQGYHRFAHLYPLLPRETLILHYMRHLKFCTWFLQEQEQAFTSSNSTCHWSSPKLGAKGTQDMVRLDPELILLGVIDPQDDFHRHSFQRCLALIWGSTILTIQTSKGVVTLSNKAWKNVL